MSEAVKLLTALRKVDIKNQSQEFMYILIENGTYSTGVGSSTKLLQLLIQRRSFMLPRTHAFFCLFFFL